MAVDENEPTEDNVEQTTIRPSNPLPWSKNLAFGIGHFYNDLCASMWFTYLLLFFKKVRMLNAAHAGLLMFIGQFVDGIATPLVGLSIDRNFLPSCIVSYFGPRNSWHFIGTILVTCSFPLIFNRCFIKPNDNPLAPAMNQDIYLVLYYAPFIAIFQIGWACVQISHLALIPQLASTESRRATLNSLRYAFTVLANLLIYTMLFIYLYAENAPGEGTQIGPLNFYDFRDTSLLATMMGVTVTTIYHFTIEDRAPAQRHRLMSTGSIIRSSEHTVAQRVHTWRQWFQVPHFYIIGAVYMLVRMYVNISQAFFPFYVEQVQHLPKMYVSILPMFIYLVSFVVSNLTSISCVSKNISRKIFFNLGGYIGLAACTIMLLLNSGHIMPLTEANKPIAMVLLSVCMGIANSLCAVSALSFVADLIHDNTETGAFVYGAMSLVDKLANGIAYQVIELFNPECDASSTKEECMHFYRYVQAIAAGGCLLLALICFIPLWRRPIEHRYNVLDDDEIVDSTMVISHATEHHR